MFKIVGGKTEFNQWDLNQKVTGNFMEVGEQIIFQSATGAVYITYTHYDNGTVVAVVPNKLLQTARPMLVNYGQGAKALNQYDTQFRVAAQTKPADYVYTDNTNEGKPVPGSGGGLVVCNETSPTQDITISKLKDLQVSFPNADYIVAHAFAECTELVSIELPNVTKIKPRAFRNCYKLMSIDLPSLTVINEEAFLNCTGLRSANLPKVSGLDTACFQECGKMTTVNAPNLITIGSLAFALSGLTSADFPKVESIGHGAFADCTHLTTVNTPNVILIDANAFIGCQELMSIDLHKVTYIGASAFSDCIKLSTIIMRTTETVCEVDLTAFDGTNFLMPDGSGGHIYVPSVMYEYYRAAYEPTFTAVLGEGSFDLIVRKIEDYPEICG